MRIIVSFVLVMAMLFVLFVPVAGAAGSHDLQKLVNETAKYMLSAVPAPGSADVGGDWAVFGLARSGYAVPEGYFEGYYARLEAYVKEKKGVLHNRKYTDYSRTIVVLSALGKDPSNVGGYDLLTPLGDYKKTIWQGLNGPIWALIALDSGNYAVPQNPDAEVQAFIDSVNEKSAAGP